jgi:hypothetical protein
MGYWLGVFQRGSIPFARTRNLIILGTANSE